MFNVLGSIAEFERDLIRERVVAGQDAARRRGMKLGRPQATDESQRARIARLRASGHSMREIGALLALPKSTVARVVKRKRTGAA
jgi:DNA invertase Pin-like site-specific DNA recombinase